MHDFEPIDCPVKALDKLADYLARRDHSEKELITKLSKKFTPTAIQKALQQAKEQHWLPDPNELAQRVADSLNRKSKGHHYIQKYLAEKGLPQTPRDSEVELKKARNFLATRFASDKLSFEDKQKAARWLQSRGFDSETIGSIVIY